MNKTLKIIIATTCLMLCFFSFVTAYSYQYEYFTVNIPGLTINTELARVTKSTNANYAKIRIYNDSTITSADVWVKNSDGDWISDKVGVLPDGETRTIMYKDGASIDPNKNVYFYGEQDSATSKIMHGKAFAY